ncbi:uncharacterized protein LOC129591430 isoform X2 [Paramacrobiotus metropolitanus]|nr:uncharacterized protein LOC129591430 isoform X2 [Paramacrobiotus metropolitanus]
MERPSKIAKKEDAHGPCPFHTLPIELVAHVYSYLDIFEISRCSTVCKRFELVANNSPLVQKTVIVDVRKWDKNDCNKDDERVWKKTGIRDSRGKILLKRFVTRSTRLLILRWPLDRCPPEAELSIHIPDPNPDMFDSSYRCHYSVVNRRGACSFPVHWLGLQAVEIIANESPLVRKSVIVDIHKWYTNGLNEQQFLDEDSGDFHIA